jgi:hypothetical protein
MVLVDPPMLEGHCGAPIIGPNGRVVAMYTGKTLQKDTISSLSEGGLPADHLEHIVHQIIDHHTVGTKNQVYIDKHGPIGIPIFHSMSLGHPLDTCANLHVHYARLKAQSLLPPEYRWVDIKGLLVKSETINGLRIGDIITHVNGTSVCIDRTQRTIADVLWKLTPSSTTVTLSIVRVHFGVPQYLEYGHDVVIDPIDIRPPATILCSSDPMLDLPL